MKNLKLLSLLVGACVSLPLWADGTGVVAPKGWPIQDRLTIGSVTGPALTDYCPGNGVGCDSTYDPSVDTDNTNNFFSRPVDAAFTYGGNGGDGEPGYYGISPAWTVGSWSHPGPPGFGDSKLASWFGMMDVYEQYRASLQLPPASIVPVAVIYSANYSGDSSGGKTGEDLSIFTTTDPIVLQHMSSLGLNSELEGHYINFISQLVQLEAYVKSHPNSPAPALIINPDFIGTYQQCLSAGSCQLKAPDVDMGIPIYQALTDALTYLSCDSTVPITVSKDDVMALEPKVHPNDPDVYVHQLQGWLIWKEDGPIQRPQSGTVRCPVAYFANPEVFQRMPQLLTPAAVQSVPLPDFIVHSQGSIQDYVSSLNWLVRYFAPDVQFSWQYNVGFSVDTAGHGWLHQASHGNADEMVSEKVQMATDFLSQVLYTSRNAQAVVQTPEGKSLNLLPDFLTFDKYERDVFEKSADPAVPFPYVSQPYLYNVGDWNVFVGFVGGVSDGLAQKMGVPVPAMLWQIPGGHLQQASGDVDVRGDHGDTAGDYFMGDAGPSVLANLAPYIKNISAFPSSAYFTSSTSVFDYLSEGAWGPDHVGALQKAHVFAILWGGGSTTGVTGNHGHSGPVVNDGGWLWKQMAYTLCPCAEYQATAMCQQAKTMSLPIAQACSAASASV